jgi:hypothetical protein
VQTSTQHTQLLVPNILHTMRREALTQLLHAHDRDTDPGQLLQAIGQDEIDILQPSEILRMTGGLFMMEKAGALLRCGRK